LPWQCWLVALAIPAGTGQWLAILDPLNDTLDTTPHTPCRLRRLRPDRHHRFVDENRINAGDGAVAKLRKSMLGKRAFPLLAVFVVLPAVGVQIQELLGRFPEGQALPCFFGGSILGGDFCFNRVDAIG
jgi:hypothetical protein